MLPVKKFKEVADGLGLHKYHVVVLGANYRTWIFSDNEPSITIYYDFSFENAEVTDYKENEIRGCQGRYLNKWITAKGNVKTSTGQQSDLEFKISLPNDPDFSLMDAELQLKNGNVSGSGYVEMIAQMVGPLPGIRLNNTINYSPTHISMSNGLVSIVEEIHGILQANLDFHIINSAIFRDGLKTYGINNAELNHKPIRTLVS